MQPSNKNIAIIVVLVVIIAAVAGIWWWRSLGEPEGVLSRIERDLVKYEEIIAACKKETTIEAKTSCEDKFDSINKSLSDYEEELKKLQVGEESLIKGGAISTSTVGSTI